MRGLLIGFVLVAAAVSEGNQCRSLFSAKSDAQSLIQEKMEKDYAAFEEIYSRELVEILDTRADKEIELQVYRIEADQRFSKDDLFFVEINGDVYYFTSNPGTLVSTNGERYRQVTGETIGFHRLATRRFHMSKEFDLRIEADGKILLEAVENHNVERAVSMLKDAGRLSPAVEKLLLTHQEVVSQFLKEHNWTFEPLLKASYLEAKTSGSKEPAVFVSFQSGEKFVFYFEGAEFKITNLDDGKYGFKRMPDIKFKEGNNKLELEQGFVKMSVRDPSLHWKGIESSLKPELFSKVEGFAKEIQELLSKGELHPGDILIGNLAEAHSLKTGDAILVLRSLNGEVYYLSDKPESLGVTDRVGLFKQVSSKLQGDKFDLPAYTQKAEGSEVVQQLVLAQGIGFSATQETKLIVDVRPSTSGQ